MQLQPDTMAATLAEIDRRLNALEVAQRVGLNRVRFAWSTHSSVPSAATFGAWEQGPVAATWADDRGNTGTGYPKVTVTTGTKVIILSNAALQGLAVSATYRSFTALWGVGVDSGNPSAWTGQTMSSFEVRGTDTAPIGFTPFMSGRDDLTPGSHEFATWAYWVDTNPAAVILPGVGSAFLAVIPLD